MTDVLIREKLWDVVSGEKVRPADPDFLDTETHTGRATVDIIDDDADDGQTAESSSAAATRSRPTRSTATRPKFLAAMSGAADKDKNKEGEAATSKVVEFSPTIERTIQRQEEWDARSTCALSHIRGALTDSILMTLGSFRTARELWLYLQNMYGKVTIASLYNLKAALYDRKLKEGEDVRKHLNSLKAMREEYIRAGGKFDDQDFSYIILQSLPSSYEPTVDSILSRADKALLDPDAIASILYTKSDRVSSNSSSSVAAKASYQGGLKRKSQNSGDGQKNHKKSSQSGKAETAKPAKRKKMCICGTGKHDEADCYHLHPEKLPESVKAMQKKLAAENNAKKVIMCSQVPCETAYLTIHRAFGAKSLQGFSKDSWIFDYCF